MSDLNQHPLIQKYCEANRFGDYLGMQFYIVQPGVVDYRLKITENHLATPKSVHGGVIAGLMDAIVGVGALSCVCSENNVVSTVEMKITFLRPVALNDELTGVSAVLQAGRRLLFIEGKIYNQREELIAAATATMNAYPNEKAGY